MSQRSSPPFRRSRSPYVSASPVCLSCGRCYACGSHLDLEYERNQYGTHSQTRQEDRQFNKNEYQQTHARSQKDAFRNSSSYHNRSFENLISPPTEPSSERYMTVEFSPIRKSNSCFDLWAQSDKEKIEELIQAKSDYASSVDDSLSPTGFYSTSIIIPPSPTKEKKDIPTNTDFPLLKDFQRNDMIRGEDQCSKSQSKMTVSLQQLIEPPKNVNLSPNSSFIVSPPPVTTPPIHKESPCIKRRNDNIRPDSLRIKHKYFTPVMTDISIDNERPKRPKNPVPEPKNYEKAQSVKSNFPLDSVELWKSARSPNPVPAKDMVIRHDVSFKTETKTETTPITPKDSNLSKETLHKNSGKHENVSVKDTEGDEDQDQCATLSPSSEEIYYILDFTKDGTRSSSSTISFKQASLDDQEADVIIPMNVSEVQNVPSMLFEEDPIILPIDAPEMQTEFSAAIVDCYITDAKPLIMNNNRDSEVQSNKETHGDNRMEFIEFVLGRKDEERANKNREEKEKTFNTPNEISGKKEEIEIPKRLSKQALLVDLKVDTVPSSFTSEVQIKPSMSLQENTMLPPIGMPEMLSKISDVQAGAQITNAKSMAVSDTKDKLQLPVDYGEYIRENLINDILNREYKENESKSCEKQESKCEPLNKINDEEKIIPQNENEANSFSAPNFESSQFAAVTVSIKTSTPVIPVPATNQQGEIGTLRCENEEIDFGIHKEDQASGEECEEEKINAVSIGKLEDAPEIIYHAEVETNAMENCVEVPCSVVRCEHPQVLGY